MKSAFIRLTGASLFIFLSCQVFSKDISCEEFHSIQVPDSSLHSANFISYAEAERVLKKPVLLKDSSLKHNEAFTGFQFTYKTVKPDSISGEKSSLFFGFEEYKQISDAKRTFAVIKTENEKTAMVTKIDQGDEAFLSRDQLNSPFIMVRKNNRIFKFKLYHQTSESSLSELESVVSGVVSAY